MVKGLDASRLLMLCCGLFSLGFALGHYARGWRDLSDGTSRRESLGEHIMGAAAGTLALFVAALLVAAGLEVLGRL